MVAFLGSSVPVTYVIDTAKKLIHTTCSSPLTYPEVINHFHELQRDSACAGYLDVLLDVTTADAVPDAKQLGTVTVELGAIRDKVRFGICAIAASRDAMFGMMRMFEVYATRYFTAVRVFRELSEAEAWLAEQKLATPPGADPGPPGI